MRLRGHRKSVAFFITLGACLVGLAVALNVSWVLLSWREMARACLDLARTRYPQLPADSFSYAEAFDNGERALVKGDADDLRMALTNLIDNAVKYSGGAVRVSVGVAPLGEKQLELRVT